MMRKEVIDTAAPEVFSRPVTTGMTMEQVLERINQVLLHPQGVSATELTKLRDDVQNTVSTGA